MFKSGLQGLAWVRDRLAEGGPATLAVAFWGADAIEQLGLARRISTGAPVHIICNLAMGGTNPNEVRRLLQLENVHVKQSDRLHGKVYHFGETVMIGSSNASSNGLSFEGENSRGWDEANYVTCQEHDLVQTRDWIAGLQARRITAADLDEADIVWSRRRQCAIPFGRDVGITEIVAQGAAALEGMQIYLAVSGSAMTEAGAEAVERERSQTGLDIEAFQDWDDLPKAGQLITFYRGPRGGLTYEGCYRRDPNVADGKSSDGYSMQWCFDHPIPLGLKFPAKDINGWRRLVDELIFRCGIIDKDHSQWIALEELAEPTLGSQRPRLSGSWKRTKA